ncbi:isochorismatase family protein [Actinoplanes sp. NPDC051343]|jgi:nicotinamidase-related amidase|uniref:isochorismatase family protein n=1 Tax=Actinoplanes sp. NPDC051343 TaxID=3363906 RepID=UPI00378D7553
MTVSTLDPKTALVAIDLQARIVGAPVGPIPAADVVARTAELAAAFREHGLPVVLVKVGAGPDEATPGRIQGRRSGGAPRPAGGEEIVDEIRGAGDIIVHKRNWGAFYGTDLDLQLRRRGVTQIVLTGIATSIGVESTARAAHEHGYHVTLASDAMTDINTDAHANSVDRIFGMLGELGTTAEIIELLAKTR